MVGNVISLEDMWIVETVENLIDKSKKEIKLSGESL